MVTATIEVSLCTGIITDLSNYAKITEEFGDQICRELVVIVNTVRFISPFFELELLLSQQ